MLLQRPRQWSSSCAPEAPLVLAEDIEREYAQVVAIAIGLIPIDHIGSSLALFTVVERGEDPLIGAVSLAKVRVLVAVDDVPAQRHVKALGELRVRRCLQRRGREDRAKDAVATVVLVEELLIVVVAAIRQDSQTPVAALQTRSQLADRGHIFGVELAYIGDIIRPVVDAAAWSRAGSRRPLGRSNGSPAIRPVNRSTSNAMARFIGELVGDLDPKCLVERQPLEIAGGEIRLCHRVAPDPIVELEIQPGFLLVVAAVFIPGDCLVFKPAVSALRFSSGVGVGSQGLAVREARALSRRPRSEHR